jgi:hypothetical protein
VPAANRRSVVSLTLLASTAAGVLRPAGARGDSLA